MFGNQFDKLEQVKQLREAELNAACIQVGSEGERHSVIVNQPNEKSSNAPLVFPCISLIHPDSFIYLCAVL